MKNKVETKYNPKYGVTEIIFTGTWLDDLEVTPDELYELMSNDKFVRALGKNPKPNEQGILITDNGFRRVLLKSFDDSQKVTPQDAL